MGFSFRDTVSEDDNDAEAEAVAEDEKSELSQESKYSWGLKLNMLYVRLFVSSEIFWG